MTPIDKVHTSCKHCVFAIYKNTTQTGCHLNYINILQNNNIEILPAYDDNSEFYIINKKQCIGYTTKDSLKKHNLENALIEDIVDKYNVLNTLNYLLVINTLKLSLIEVENLLQRLVKFKIQPKKIILIRYPDPNNKFIYYDVERILNSVSIPWKIVSAQTLDVEFETLIDTTLSVETKYRFVLCVNKIDENLENFVIEANEIVHNQMKQFFLLRNQDSTTLLFPATVYRYQKFVNDNLLTNHKYHTIL